MSNCIFIRFDKASPEIQFYIKGLFKVFHRYLAPDFNGKIRPFERLLLATKFRGLAIEKAEDALKRDKRIKKWFFAGE